jgi:hypothetical protein
LQCRKFRRHAADFFDEPGWKVAALGQLVEVMDGFFDLGVKHTLWFGHRRSLQTQDVGVVVAHASPAAGVCRPLDQRQATSIPVLDSARQMTCLSGTVGPGARFDGRAQ